jgi:hypothetical protein
MLGGAGSPLIRGTATAAPTQSGTAPENLPAIKDLLSRLEIDLRQ